MLTPGKTLRKGEKALHLVTEPESVERSDGKHLPISAPGRAVIPPQTQFKKLATQQENENQSIAPAKNVPDSVSSFYMAEKRKELLFVKEKPMGILFKIKVHRKERFLFSQTLVPGEYLLENPFVATAYIHCSKALSKRIVCRPIKIKFI